MKTLLLKDSKVILPDRTIDNAAVLVEGDRIRDISRESGKLSADETIDLDGATLFPGFIDIHIHGAVGVDTMEASADDLMRVSEFLATQGVTGWVPTLVPGPVEDYRRALSSIAEAAKSGRDARILGVHYEGPFVN